VPLQKLQFRPGVNREGTTLANEGGWFDCDKVRFRSGYPEKIGGWAAISYATFLGVCRSLWNWITLKGFNLAGVGTNLKFYVENGGAYYDITPIRETNSNTTSPGSITLTASDTTMTVSDNNAESLQAQDFVTITGANTIGGVNVNGEYQIETVTSGTTYTVTLAAAATGTANNSGITIAYQISVGPAINTVGTGWGVPPWGGFIPGSMSSTLNASINASATTITVASTSGFAASGAIWIEGEYINYTSKTATDFTIPVSNGRGADGTTAASHNSGALVSQATSFPGWGEGYFTASGPKVALRLWSQANFGEYILFNPRGGAIYIWQPGTGATPGFTVRAVELSPTSVTPSGWTTTVTDAYCPSLVNEILISDQSRILIAFGCNDPSGVYWPTTLDPMLIRWADAENYGVWQPNIATNFAGDARLSHGSYIVGALQTRQEILVWTDTAIYSMQFVGFPDVWQITLLADNISIASQNAMATAAGVVYWMGTDKFYTYSGRVETLPCSLRQYVFEDINRDQQEQFLAGTNEGYSEVWWFYCSISGPDGTGTVNNPNTTIDRYVIFNYLDRVWYYGTLDRTAWLDSPLRQFPMAATSTNLLVYHEAAVDDGSTNPPSAISSYIQSSDFDIEDGHNYGFVWRIIPDITFNGSTTPSPDYPQVKFVVRPRQNPGSGYGVAADPTIQSTKSYAGQQIYNVQEFTEIVYSRVRGRQMAFKIESDTLGTQWQLGVPRIDVRPDGRR
jgi:hypothetical protein